MKIAEPKWSRFSKDANQDAIDAPQVGDYWSEMYCPYFLIVDVTGDNYTVLIGFPKTRFDKSGVDWQCAKMDAGDNKWCFDYTKHTVVTKEWLKQQVSYNSIPGFYADVQRYGSEMGMVKEWLEENPDYVPTHIPYFKQHAEWWLGV